MSVKRRLRRIAYLGEKLAQRSRFSSLAAPIDGWPTLLGISFPKSGTHLLDQVLLGFSKFAPFSRRLHSFYAEYEGETGRKHTSEQAAAWLSSLDPLDVASAHLFARTEIVERVRTPAFLPYFIYRDPRDVVVSHVHYVTDMEPKHVHHRYYAALPDFDARLRASILGRPEADNEFPDVSSRFAPYTGWLDLPAVLPIHFEDLVNDRSRTLASVARHFLNRLPLGAALEEVVQGLERSINPRRSPTFRSGKTGEWRSAFKPEHKAIFKEVAGDLLIRLGYETGKDW